MSDASSFLFNEDWRSARSRIRTASMEAISSDQQIQSVRAGRRTGLRKPSKPGRESTARVYCTSFDSKIGHIYIASTENGVCKVSIPKETKQDFFRWLVRHFDEEQVVENKYRNKEIIDQLTRYFNGALARFTCGIDQVGTPFQIRVWRELRKIPYGSTSNYKRLANKVGVPNGFRAIGRACATNPLPIIVPCHRVIASNGDLNGYSCGIKTKEFLLRLEGAIIL